MNATYRPVVVWTAAVLWVGLLFFASALRAVAAEPPIALHPENPHYFVWHGEPTLLITSGEHYGAVMNLDFDYVRYFDELQRNKLNHTRTFSGVYRETPARSASRITHSLLWPNASSALGHAATCPGTPRVETSSM